ncbi:flagellar motor switch protein FliG [Borrelia miyamotoi]|uniref:Flagellar motor switch protein FliG n=1 Tax=Borrelia miyamotoi TaxID=47466 RepID=A0AAQ2WX06_9SPIR|nr:FliG C-terminal domain-containing protein [Borrelia miyamotoi]AGT27216.1 flagellar motor switch protein FliG [Borrelia miyamotoi LB-2001]AJA58403.1 flagellar motor switch protein FliG [Borrelia miyamotoi]AOW95481.1 flagellar motor switch protein FliG [Borrelia miyamotoi]QTL83366.1 flagellar motor switch protein FliG [Borrelia miyamotoi]WAZ85338.1 flagellar motor switch protein FliG [Borrelia miyamotoi]
MQDPRLSKYQNAKNLGVKTLKSVAKESLNNDFSDSEMQGSLLKSWVNLVKRGKKATFSESSFFNKKMEKPGFIRKESKLSKIAKYFLAIGLEKSAQIMAELDDSDIIAITREITKIKYITPSDKKRIIQEFEELVRSEKKYFKIDDKFTYEVLNKSLSKAKAKEIYKKVTGIDPFLPFDYLSFVENEQLWALIKDENIKTLLIIYNYLTKEQKKYVFSMFEKDIKKKFIKELAKPRRLNMDMVEIISNRLKSRFEMQGRLKTEKLDGSKILVDILSYMDAEDEKNLLTSIDMKALDPLKDSEIREKIFDINIILRITDNDMHNILREFTDNDIAVIIKDKSNEIRDKILFNVSRRRKDSILEEESFLKKVKKKDIKLMTTSFVDYIKNLTLKGDLVIYRKNEEFV